MSIRDRLANFRQFKPPGPVAARFLRDRTSLVRFIRGPVGGGKSVTCVFDGLKNSSEAPVCVDKLIRFRLAVIGLTYGQLERNLFPTWTSWLPKDGGDWTEGEFSGGMGRYAQHLLKWDVIRTIDGEPRRVPVDFEAIFAAIGENAVEAFMRGFEPTAFWFYEADQLPKGLVDHAIFRLGRFPPKRLLPPGVEQRSYIIGDLNSPDVDSWYYDLMEENKPEGFEQFVQPSGLSPQAENLQNLPKGYYERMAATLAKKKNELKRFVHNEYAPSPQGKPVFEDEYSDDRHYAAGELEVLPGVDLEIGVDAGVRAPAATINQRSSRGQFRVLAEVVPGRVGTKTFAAMILQTVQEIVPAHLAGKVVLRQGWGDPAGFAGGVEEEGQLSFMQQLSSELGIPILPTESNEFDLRLDAVRDELNANIDANTPAMVISRRCKVLRKGYASHYAYPKHKQQGGDGSVLAPKPPKNPWSHVHDANQYYLLGKKGLHGTIARKVGAGPANRQAASSSTGGNSVMKSAYRPFG